MGMAERMARVNTNQGRRVSYRTGVILALIAGASGIALQLLPDGEILSFMVSSAALGGLIGGAKAYNERERQQLSQSYKIAYEWLLLVIMSAYAWIVLARWLNIMAGAASFINGHWPGLVISVMCLLMGMAGLQRNGNESAV
jgi:hypothetical protein